MKKSELKQLIKEVIKEVDETNNKKEIEPITDINSVVKVYSGKPGCMCGCKGRWIYASAYRDLASKNRGYKINDDEVSDKSIKLIVNKMNSLLKINNYKEVKRTDQYLFIDTGERYYAAYFADYMKKEL